MFFNYKTIYKVEYLNNQTLIFIFAANLIVSIDYLLFYDIFTRDVKLPN
jgi:hypothetical protein